MAMIHEITEQVGRHKRRQRVGRGPSSGRGKTAGRGHKGAKSRSGFTGSQHPTFEGGQMPYFRRIPKRGFNNARFRTEYSIVNIKMLETRFNDGDEVTPQALRQAGLIDDPAQPVKILAEGELTKKLTVSATRFSAAARAKIESAGGSIQLLDKRGRPAQPDGDAAATQQE